jgi:hypothetical protein
MGFGWTALEQQHHVNLEFREASHKACIARFARFRVVNIKALIFGA